MRWAAIASALLGASMVAGCTFLIQFEDAPPVTEGGVEGGGSDGARPDAAPEFPPACDPTFPVTEVSCGTTVRPNCAKSTSIFPTYPRPRGEDLVTCNGGAKASCVQHCPHACSVFPPGFPDQCDDCAGRKDGTYCVRDLRGADPRNDGIAVECVGGKATKLSTCGNTGAGCESKCSRTTGPFPSCCK